MTPWYVPLLTVLQDGKWHTSRAVRMVWPGLNEIPALRKLVRRTGLRVLHRYANRHHSYRLLP